jgi:DNA-directed RNA polymerase specialized sigma24 family protein
MTTYGRLNSEAFEAFLAWLSPDRAEAGRRFEQIKKKLVRLLTQRGCHIPDELFYEAVNRVGNKVRSGAIEPSVHPLAYCHGVARNVLKEYWRTLKREATLRDVPTPRANPAWDERELACLEECLEQLSEPDRNLLSRYHEFHGREKIEVRSKMGTEEGGVNKLRVKVCRKMKTLRECVFDCVNREGAVGQ